jgi:hypothetical protein
MILSRARYLFKESESREPRSGRIRFDPTSVRFDAAPSETRLECCLPVRPDVVATQATSWPMTAPDQHQTIASRPQSLELALSVGPDVHDERQLSTALCLEKKRQFGPSAIVTRRHECPLLINPAIAASFVSSPRIPLYGR